MSMLAIIEAHCRFVAGLLERSAQGCRMALALLAAFPGCCARNLPDITAMTPGIFESLVSFEVLRKPPSRHVRLAVLRMLSAVTPLVQMRSERQWSIWFATALDPHSSVAQQLRTGTPESQLAVQVSGSTAGTHDHRREPARPSREIKDMKTSLAQVVQERDELRRQLEQAHADARAAGDRVAADRAAASTSEGAALAATLAELDAERDRAKKSAVELADLAEVVAHFQADKIVRDAAQRDIETSRDKVVQERDELRRQLEMQSEAAARAPAPAELRAARAELDAVRTENEQLRQELTRAERDLAEVRTECDRAKKSEAEMEATVGGLSRDLTDVRQEHEHGKKAAEELRRELQAAEERCGHLEDKIETVEGELAAARHGQDGLRQALDAANACAGGLREEIKKGEQQLDEQKRRAAEEKAAAQVAADQDKLQKWRESEEVRGKLADAEMKLKASEEKRAYALNKSRRLGAELYVRKTPGQPTDELAITRAVEELLKKSSERDV